MKRVYVVNKGGHDFTPAEQFGELVYCSEGPISKYDVGQMYRILYQAMEGSNGDDYLLLTSLTSLCSVGAAILAHKHGRVNFLIWRGDQYVERSLVFDSEPEGESLGRRIGKLIKRS